MQPFEFSMTTAADDDDQPPSLSTPAWAERSDEKDTKTKTQMAMTIDNTDAQEYNPSSTLSCPPLVQLQTYGFCCPFLETEEEHDARVGINNLQNYPITLYKKKLVEDIAKDVKDAVPKSAGGLMDGIGQLLGKAGGNKQEMPMTYVGVPATISIIDTDDHGPVIQIRTLDEDDPTKLTEYITSGKPWWENANLKDKPPANVIPIYMVDKIASGWSLTSDHAAGGVKLYAAPLSKGFLSSGSGAELLRFDTLGGGGNTISNALTGVTHNEPNKYSDKVIVQLKSLIDWNRRRMARDIKKGNVSVAPKANSPGYISIT